MPIIATTGAFSVGQDGRIILKHPLAPGGQVDLPNGTSFDAKPVYDKVKSKLLTGQTLYADLIEGWQGNIECDRGDSGLDDLVNAIHAVQLAGGLVQTGDVFQYVTNPDGSQSSYHYMGASFAADDLGSYKGNDVVKQKVSFMATQRVNV